MSIKAVCPSCGNVHQLADTFSFRTVECSQCQTIFPTPKKSAENEESPPKKKSGPPPLPPKPKPVAESNESMFEVLPDEEQESTPISTKSVSPPTEKKNEPPKVSETPIQKPKPKSIEHTAYEDDEDNEDERPKRSTKSRRPLDDEDEDDQDERPRRSPVKSKRRVDDTDDTNEETPAKKAGLSLGVIAVLMFMIGAAAAGLYFFNQDDPVEVVEKPVNPTDSDASSITKPLPKVETNPPPKKMIEPKPETKQEPKTEPKPEPKPEPKTEPKPETKQELKTEPKPEPKPEPIPEPKKPTNFAMGATLVNPVDRPLDITPFKAEGGTAEVLTNGVVKDVCAVAGGKYLLVSCPEAQKIHLIEVSTAKIVKTFPVKSQDILIAGGMDHFVIVTPSTKIVDRYLLESLSLETSAKIDAPNKIIVAAMGSRTNGPIILGGPQAQKNASKMALMFIDLPTLKEVEIEDATGDFQVGFGTSAYLRVSANGQLLGAWYEKLNPSGLQTVVLSGNTLKGSYLKQAVGSVVPDEEGKNVFTSKGKFAANLQNPGEGGILIPSVTGKWFIELQSDNKGVDSQFVQVMVREEGKAEPLAEFKNIAGFDGKKDPFVREINQMPVDRRLWLITQAKVLITIPPTANKLQFFAVGK